MRAFSLLCVLLLCGCAEKNRDTIVRYQTRFADKRAMLREVAQSLPAPGVGLRFSNPGGLTPKPVYFAGRPDDSNTDFLSFEELSDPDVKPSLELYLGQGLGTALRWTGPKNPMPDRALNRKDKTLSRGLDRALNTRYLVVVRSFVDGKGEAADAKTVRGGARTFEALVIDLQTKKLGAAVAVLAKPADEGSASGTANQKTGEVAESKDPAAAEKAAQSAAWNSARELLVPKLEQATGGTFRLDR